MCASACVCVYESTFMCVRLSVFIFVGSGRRIDPTAAAGIRSDRERTDYVDRGLAAAGAAAEDSAAATTSRHRARRFARNGRAAQRCHHRFSNRPRIRADDND